MDPRTRTLVMAALAILLTAAPAAYADTGSRGGVVAAICGDNYVSHPAEECDDGGKCTDGANCTVGGKACADKSACMPKDGDGCSSKCKYENQPATSCCDKLGTVTVDTANVGTLNATTMHADALNVKNGAKIDGSIELKGDILVAGSKLYPVHFVEVVLGGASSFGDPWATYVKLAYGAMWKLGEKTLVGFEVDVGVGMWNRWNTRPPVVMLPLGGFLRIGNMTGGGFIGPEVWMLHPMWHHPDNEKWELMTMIKAGGWFNLPDFTSAHSFVCKVWLGVPAYKPKNPSSPHFDNPLLMVGIDLSYRYEPDPPVEKKSSP